MLGQSKKSGKFAISVKRLLKLKIIRYLFSGGISYLVDLLSFLFLHDIVKSPLPISVGISFILGLSFSFLVNKTFVFAANDNARFKTSYQIILFITLVMFNLVFTYMLVKLLLETGAPSFVAKTVPTICITLWNFLLYKNIIFKNNN